MPSTKRTSTKENIINATAKLLPKMFAVKKNKISGNQSGVRTEIYHTDVDLFGSSLRARKGISNIHLVAEPRRSDGIQRSASIGDLCLDLGFGDVATDYTRNTTLHGLRYVGDSELHLFERLFWSVAFVLGILGAGVFISNLYTRWKDSPMIVAVSPTPTLLQSIPFPAITICNMNGARKTIAEAILANKDTSRESRFEKEMIKDICGMPIDPSKRRIPANWTTMQKFLVKVYQPCHDMLVSCKWRSRSIPCNDIFNPDLNDEGMCCAFNKVRRDFIFRNPRLTVGLMNYTFPYPGIDWTPETGYPTGTPIDTNPWRAWGPGRSMGLSVVLDVEVDEYFCSSTASIGFKTMIHNPVEQPRISDLAYFLSPGVETRVEIIPKLASSTYNLRNIPLAKRRCLFNGERELRFYRTYTQRNCQLECHSNFTLDTCECVPFFLPKDQDTRICGTSDSDCVDMAKSMMEQLQLSQLENSTHEENENPDTCNCLPPCVTVQYSKQMSASKLEDSFKVKTDYLVGHDPAYYKENMAVVHFFFTEDSFTGTEKGEIFGFTEFLSSTGGLLGLFLGFSIMSAAEVAYYLSLRVLCSWWRARKPTAPNLKHKHPFPFTQ